MNDSLSVSSSYSSSNNSNSNSLNRSLFTNGSYSTVTNVNQQQNLLAAQLNSKLAEVVDEYLPNGPIMMRRRAKSQDSLDLDDISSVTEQNKKLLEDIFYLKKVFFDFLIKKISKNLNFILLKEIERKR